MTHCLSTSRSNSPDQRTSEDERHSLSIPCLQINSKSDHSIQSQHHPPSPCYSDHCSLGFISLFLLLLCIHPSSHLIHPFKLFLTHLSSCSPLLISSLAMLHHSPSQMKNFSNLGCYFPPYLSLSSPNYFISSSNRRKKQQKANILLTKQIQAGVISHKTAALRKSHPIPFRTSFNLSLVSLRLASRPPLDVTASSRVWS